MYFEHKLPAIAPRHLTIAAGKAMQETLDCVRARMDLLEEALNVSGLKPETFAALARKLFLAQEHTQKTIDNFTPSEISEFAWAAFDGEDQPTRLNWAGVDTFVDTAFVSTKEWEQLRMLSIGGSDASIIKKLNHWREELGLYYDKTGYPTVDDSDRQWVFDRGHIVEDRVVEAFCAQSGMKRIPETRMFVSRTHPNVTANPDAIVTPGNGKLYVFEAKTTIAENFEAWANDKVPPYYACQCIHYPAVLNDERIAGTYIGCIFTNDITVGGMYIDSQYNLNERFVVRYIEKDEAECKAHLDLMQSWYEEYVINENPPAVTVQPDLAVQAANAASATSASDNLVEFQLPDWEDTIKEFLAAKEQQSNLIKQADAFKEKAQRLSVDIIKRLADSTRGVCQIDDKRGYEIKNVAQARNSVDAEKLRVVVDTAAPFLPDDIRKEFEACFIVKETSPIFTVKEKSLAKIIGKK